MQAVVINIDASANKYWGSVEFTDKKGVTHARYIEGEHEGTINGNCLRAGIAAFRILNRPCMVTVHTERDYITNAYKNGWVTNWERNGWKRANGEPLKNAEAWKEFQEAKAPHSVRFVLIKGGKR